VQNLHSEGFAIGPQRDCAQNAKPVYWADDSETDGHALRQGFIPC